MPTITSQRAALERSINWTAYREQRAHLAELFSVIAHNGGHKIPLAVGIRADIIGANAGLTPDEVRHFLRAYTFGPKYLRALKKGAWRYGLDGAVDGWVSPNEAHYARLALQAHYATRERRRLVRAIGAVVAEVAAERDAETYAYRFGRLGPNAFNPQREYPGSYGAASVEAA